MMWILKPQRYINEIEGCWEDGISVPPCGCFVWGVCSCYWPGTGGACCAFKIVVNG